MDLPTELWGRLLGRLCWRQWSKREERVKRRLGLVRKHEGRGVGGQQDGAVIEEEARKGLLLSCSTTPQQLARRCDWLAGAGGRALPERHTRLPPLGLGTSSQAVYYRTGIAWHCEAPQPPHREGGRGRRALCRVLCRLPCRAGTAIRYGADI
jgi:hypothetical protein